MEQCDYKKWNDNHILWKVTINHLVIIVCLLFICIVGLAFSYEECLLLLEKISAFLPDIFFVIYLLLCSSNEHNLLADVCFCAPEAIGTQFSMSN